MQPSQVAELLGVAAGTIRTWSVGEFKRFLSPGGQGGGGGRRDFDEQDVRILNHIAYLKHRGLLTKQIVEALEKMQADGWIDLPQLPESAQSASFAVIPAVAADSMLAASARGYNAEIEMLKERLEELKQERDRAAAASEAKNEQIVDLTRRLARTEALLELYESGRLKPGE